MKPHTVINYKNKSTREVIREISAINQPIDSLIQVNYWNGNVGAVTIRQALKELKSLLSDEQVIKY